MKDKKFYWAYLFTIFPNKIIKGATRIIVQQVKKQVAFIISSFFFDIFI